MMLRRLFSRLDRVGAIDQSNSERLIVVHNHIFKNAGSTIDWALKRNFGAAFVDHRDDAAMKQGPRYLGKYLTDKPHIRAISSHHIRPPLPVISGAQLFTIMMFRHPIERVTSVYNFEKRQKGASTPGAKFASSHSLSDYVVWRMRFDVPPTIRNFHIYRSIPLPVDWRRPLTEQELDLAKDFVRSVVLLGLVDRFDASMVLFEEALRPFYPDIDLTYRPQNVGQHPHVTQSERIEKLRADVGNDIFEMLCGHNAMDMDLYGLARLLFEERVARTPDFEAKLADFRRRCAD